ncbi:MAG: proteasome accessory factor PafA2 family protein [Chloroflexi bacterium]|nr:proteasome accessory factor PafA2 family protein [Chloroflexota bacterium]
MDRYIGGSEMQFGIAPAERHASSDTVGALSREIVTANNHTQLYGIRLGDHRSALFNGGFLEVDMGHPEYATPECRTLDDIVAYEFAGRRIADSLLRLASIASGTKAYLVANNTDYRYNQTTDALNTFGYHENYHARAPEREVDSLLPFLATRQLYAGSGLVIPPPLRAGFGGDYAISQRALGVNMQTGTLTVGFYSRLAGPNRQNPFILHVTAGDCNVSPFATKLKIGACALVHQLLEDDWRPPAYLCVSPQMMLANFRRLAVAAADAGGWRYRSERGDVPAIDVQRIYLRAAERYADRDADTDWVLQAWRGCLDQLERDPMEAVQLDWVQKKALVDRLRSRGFGTEALIRVDLSYHMADPQRNVSRLLSGDAVAEDAVRRAVEHAPADTRAAGRAVAVRALSKLLSAGRQPEPIVWCKWHMVGYASRSLGEPGSVSRAVVMRDPARTYVEEATLLAKAIAETS